MIIHRNQNSSWAASVGVSDGTNNFVELQTLKLRLCSLIHLGIDLIQIFGDSLNVINWFNNSQRSLNILLLPIFEEIHALKTHFILISVCHIYRERNGKVDSLSKIGLQLDSGSWNIEERDGMVVRVSNTRPY